MCVTARQIVIVHHLCYVIFFVVMINSHIFLSLSTSLSYKLVKVISVISLLSCQMWNWPVFLAHILLRCPPRLRPWSTTLRHVHHSSQYPHFLLFPKPSPLCRWHSALSLLLSDSLWLQHRSPSQCSRSNFVLDDCKSSYAELLQHWISAHWSQ